MRKIELYLCDDTEIEGMGFVKIDYADKEYLFMSSNIDADDLAHEQVHKQLKAGA